MHQTTALLGVAICALLPLSGFAGDSPPSHSEDWSSIQEDQVQIDCTRHDGLYWCRASAIISAPYAEVRAAVEDVEAWSDMFGRVQRAGFLDTDTIFVEVEMPSPLSDRYVCARIDSSTEGEAYIYQFEAVDHPAANPGKAVSISNAWGQWRLQPEGDGTQVDYTWRMHLGWVPGWTLKEVWRNHGHGVVWGVALRAGGEPSTELF